MKHLYYALLFVYVLVSFPANMLSQTYREKYSTVLQHYLQNENDSLKYKAALFLIDNMDGHVSPEGNAIEGITDELMSTSPNEKSENLSALWHKYADEYKNVIFVPDSALIDNDFLIRNIDDAFASMERVAWRRNISFDTFCRYILPYRVRSERLSDSWRRELWDKYHYLTDDKMDVTDAFSAVMNTMYEKVKTPNPTSPYSLDVMTYNHIMHADCEQRCQLMVYILRALAIPASVDCIRAWADYSTKGHAWASLTLNDGVTYTVFEGDSVARQYNRIDASRFKIRHKELFLGDCPYMPMMYKHVSKVYRTEYAKRSCNSDMTGDEHLDSPFLRDVSEEYDLKASLTLQGKHSKALLCTFLTGYNWIPVAHCNMNLLDPKRTVFSNIGCNVVYLPIEDINGKPLTYPTLVSSNGDNRMFIPDYTKRRNITIDRKYPLCSLMPDKWQDLIGAVFEASNDSDFTNCDTLAVISSMPYGNTHIAVKNNRKYRYLRYKSPATCRGLLSELSFYTKDAGREEELKGNIIAYGVYKNYWQYISDKDYSTSIKVNKNGFWIGFDLGQGNIASICGIKFCPISDTNNVETGHIYELYCYDMGWHLLGRQTAQTGSLTFPDVPTNALLLLKDRTKGREERIFEYKDDKQIWY